MAKALLIANPVAARTSPEVTETVRRIFRAAGWQIDVRETAAATDSRRFADEAVRSGVDVVAVFGGDGTTMQAAAALVGTDVALGLVPGGTGNILAGNLRVPTGPVQAAELILAGRSRRIDLGRIERESGPQYFAVACGAGADARIMGGTPVDSKRRFGIGGYFNTLFRVLPEVRSTRFTLTVDGERMAIQAAVVLILNCGELIPPLVRVRREAVPDDGFFDLIALAADTPWEVVRGVWRAIQNVVVGTGETRYLWYARGQAITIDADPPEPVQFDGDPDGETPVTAVIQPGAIRIMAPER